MRPTPRCAVWTNGKIGWRPASVCGASTGEFQELAPIGKWVEDKAIDIFDVSGGKIVEHRRDGDDPTDFLPQPGVPDLSENANCRQFTILHRNGANGVSERPSVFPGSNPALVVAVDRPTLGTFATYACYR
jgi:hypothetical protein